MRRFVNGLPQPSTVHWHGVRLDNVMDGVPGLTQPQVEPGTEYLYDFEAPDAGTFWYHSHHRSWEQVARGLYGALVVEGPDEPPVDRDEVLLLDDWRLASDARIQENLGALHDRAHEGRIGNWITVNGDGAWSRRTARYERLRLRLVNAANARIFSIAAKGLEGWLMALDGQPLPKPEPLESLALAPGQRADLVVDVVAEDAGEAFLASREREGSFALAAFPVRGSARGIRLAAPPPLPPNPLSPLGNPDRARRLVLRMEGGAMGGLRDAVVEDRRLDIRELTERGKVWALNGRADMPERPLHSARLGESVVLEMINDTAWPHAMHLHGHHFRTLASDGGVGPLRDTLLLNREEKSVIAFVADNPGKWLLHCHMLEHSDAGMMTWIQVG